MPITTLKAPGRPRAAAPSSSGLQTTTTSGQTASASSALPRPRRPGSSSVIVGGAWPCCSLPSAASSGTAKRRAAAGRARDNLQRFRTIVPAARQPATTAPPTWTLRGVVGNPRTPGKTLVRGSWQAANNVMSNNSPVYKGLVAADAEQPDAPAIVDRAPVGAQTRPIATLDEKRHGVHAGRSGKAQKGVCVACKLRRRLWVAVKKMVQTAPDADRPRGPLCKPRRRSGICS